MDEPKRETGKWIWELDERDPDRSRMLVCSICGSRRDEGGIYNFCHICGAKMINPRGEQPPAQTEPIRINLNEPIKVKLTDWGKEIYYHQYDRVNKAVGREVCKPEYPTEDENGYTEFQLWCFIELYGMHIGMTLPNVIDPLEIVYER